MTTERTTLLGHAIRRTEDPELVTGGARYLDDLDVPGCLHAVFVRSPIAHATINGIDTSAAKAMPGVVGVYTASDIDLAPVGIMTGAEALARPRLATDRVRYVGEQIAVVVAQTREQAVDAVEAVEVDYDPLPAVTDPISAMADDAPILFPEHGSNAVTHRDPADDADFFDDADIVLRERFVIPRVIPVTMEPNGVVIVPDGDSMTVWASTQSVFAIRGDIVSALGLDESKVIVKAPAIGGGFGAKGGSYPEHAVIAKIANELQRPVRWMETRTENLLNMTHGRGQVQDVTVGAKRDGTITGWRLQIFADAGAYATRAFVPFVTRMMASGPYRIPKIDVNISIVLTNATPTGPYRGAGRPEAAAMCDRVMDLVAAETGLDPVEVRKRNFVPPDAFPFATQTGMTYDSGEYAKALDVALRLAGYDALRAEQRERRERSDRVRIGIGIGSYVEVSGNGSEYGSVTVDDDGSVTVVTGSVPHGQGHETTFAQIASSVLGVAFDRVRVVHSDTSIVPRGTGTFGSRSLQVGGTAVHNASDEVLVRAKQIAADMLEAAVDDIVVADGGLGVAGVPDRTVDWAALAKAAKSDGEQALNAELDFEQGGTFPFGTHIAVVEVDTDTGDVRLRRIVAVDDCGRVINPLLAEGQVHGGVAQGVAHMLFETVDYDADGNPLNSNLATYGFPSAAELPSFECEFTETPTPHNPLGAKGIGESGTTGSTIAVWNAVVDALGVRHMDPPFTPERVWQTLNGGGT